MAKHHGGPRQQELCAWLAANGITPNDIPIDADLTIGSGSDGARVIHYEAFVFGENEMPVLNERGTEVAIEKRTAPLLVEPPAWWVPYEKPTREQLLAAVERARKLHAAVPDHGRFTDGTCPSYCDGSHEEPPVCLSCRTHAGDPVTFPCDTICALGGEPTSAQLEEIKARWSKLYGNNQTAHLVVELHATGEEA